MERFEVSNLAKFNGMIGNIDLVVCVKTYVRVGGRRNEKFSG
ncbi:hypothetical protein LEP1GSC172_4419 [Leptospira noguchii]|uniref:Uncharacterized protein n=1 Tax=Leptospira noguchii TaxID=28182 RepID=M6VFK8_9LEPT|nr:hypothetical protein LEP1GSC172_4419 [Leptospira noguchii]